MTQLVKGNTMYNYKEKIKKTGTNLRRLRLKRGLSVEQLASLMNSEPELVLQLENGQAEEISFKQLDRLYYIFNLTSLNELIIF